MPENTTAVETIETAEVYTAYSAISTFFDCYSISNVRKQLRKNLLATTKRKNWSGGNPYDVIYFFEQLLLLMQAATVLVKNGAKRSKAVLTSENGQPDLAAFHTYCGWCRGHGPWDFFPRFLSKKEFINPYLALQKVVGFRSSEDWENGFRHLVQYSLSTGNIREFYDDMDPMEILFMLCKLAEACHLIEVRAIDEIDGVPQPKWKGENSAPGQQP